MEKVERMNVGEYLDGQPKPKLSHCPVCGANGTWLERNGDIDTYRCYWHPRVSWHEEW